jgi:2-polyprenyl-3-methyl-5-hydroxy-6-metoxy-1,4-benzoquinol methylase
MKTFATSPRPEARLKRPCALCGGERFSQLWDCGSFSFVRCVSCGLIQQNPQPETEAVLERYGQSYLEYEAERQFDYAALERKALDDLRLEEATLGLREAAKADGRLPRVLDIGCATGALLSGFKARGWDCLGVEACVEAAAYGAERFGLDIRPTTLEKARLEAGSFELVHASHLIEHLNEPGAFLNEARRLLAPSGILALTTPNADGFQARLLGSAWRSAIYDHLYLFSVRSLTRLLEAHGFTVLRLVTWGGWAAGLKPRFLKQPLDRAAKRFGCGDVVALLASPQGSRVLD